MNPQEQIDFAKSIINAEADAIAAQSNCLPVGFIEAVDICKRCTGNIVTSGAGKSSFVAQKLASTFASVGVRAWYTHPSDIGHGDLGRISACDVGILISNSGSTSEIVSLARHMAVKGCRTICITGRDSQLSKTTTTAIILAQVVEAGTLAIVPTSSIAAALAISDALALTVAGTDLKLATYRSNHPDGMIGLRLSKVDDLMRVGNECPIISESATIIETMLAITCARSGAAIVATDQLIGIVTDGDLRRAFASGIDGSTRVVSCMSSNPRMIISGSLVDDAMKIFAEYAIGELPVVDINNKPIGMLCLKDLTREVFTKR